MSTKLKIIIGAVAGILVLVLLLLFFRGSNDTTDNKITLKYWGQEEKEDIKILIDQYENKHSNISIEYEKINKTPQEYEKTLNDALASGDGPDIFQIRNDWVPKYYKKASPVPSSAYSLEDFNNTFFEIAKNDLTYNNNIYAIPFNIDTLAVIYNTTIFGDKMIYAVPDTWSDFLATANKLRDTNGDYINVAAIAMGTGNNIEYAEDILALLMIQNNTEMVSDDLSKAYFNLSTKNKEGNIVYPGTDALEFYLSFARPEQGNYTWRAEMPNSLDAFAQGKTAMVFGYASDINKIKKATNDKIKLEIAPMPQFLGGKYSYAKYWANTVSKDSKNQETAWKFLKFASEKSPLKKYLNEALLPTSRKDLAEFQEGKRYVGVFVKQIEEAITWYKGDWEKVDRIFIDLINDTTINKQPSQAAIDSAAKKVTDALEEIKKKEE